MEDLKAAILNHAREASGSGPPPSLLGILTFNRPQALERCITSFLNNLRNHGRTARIIVMDDSDQPSCQAANKACLHSLKRHYPEYTFLYAAETEKRRYAGELAQDSGIDPEVIAFALFRAESLLQSAGANRNALFLQTAGERFISVDDDVVCRISPAPGRRDDVTLSSSNDPTRIHLFTDRKTLLEENPSIDHDFMGSHDAILGRQPGNAVLTAAHASLTLDKLTPAIIRELERGAARIRISWTGIYGDSGARYPTYYLWRDRRVREQLNADADAYARLALSREIFRAPRNLAIAHGRYCQSTALGFDNSSLLPPFMPVMRGEDIIFGKTLQTCFSSALIGYMPWAVLHSPVETRGNTAAEISRSALFTSLPQIMIVLISLFPATDQTSDDAQTLGKLGAHFCVLGKMPAHQFKPLLCAQLEKAMAQRIAYLETHRTNVLHLQERWKADLGAHIEILKGKLAPAALYQSLLIQECPDRNSEERLALVQRLTYGFGRLLEAWPCLAASALALKRGGRELAVPVE